MQKESAYNYKQSFYEHVSELRKRLGISAGIFVLGGVIGYIYRLPIINLLRKPLNAPLYYNTPAGNFALIMQVSLLVGAFVALPVLAYNFIRFFEPLLDRQLKHRSVIGLAVLSLLLGSLGLVFAYVVVLPMSLHFFQSYKIDGVHALISASSYLDFVIKCLITFIFLFQIPMVVLFINRIKPLSPRRLLKYEKYVVVGSLVIALVLPFTYDPLTQFVIALPIIFLYNFSLLLVWLINRSWHKAAQPVPVQATTPIQNVVDELQKNPEPMTPQQNTAPPIPQTSVSNPLPKRVRVNDIIVPGRNVAVPAYQRRQSRPEASPKTPPRPAPRLISDFIPASD